MKAKHQSLFPVAGFLLTLLYNITICVKVAEVQFWLTRYLQSIG